MQSLIIMGNSIAANILHEYIIHDSRYAISAFSVDLEFIEKDSLCSLPVVDILQLPDRYPPEKHNVILGVGYSNLNRNREEIFHRVKKMGYQVLTYIHPDANVYTGNIGEGSIILPGAFIDVHSEIGSNTVIWGNCIVAHHARIGANCWLASGSVVSAGVNVGDNSFVGVGGIVVNDVSVGKYNIVGAGALIVKDTSDYDVFICRQTEKFRLEAEDYLRFAQI